MQKNALDLIEYLQLTAHPEGGYYKQTYRSKEYVDQKCLPARFQGDRHYSTAIYYMLAGEDFSAFHRIQSDELWHFYEGSSLNIYVINDLGELSIIKLGSDIKNGEVFQAIVRAGDWFGAKLEERSSYALVGCTVSPGFDFADFELADKKSLIEKFPAHKMIIEEMCR